VKQSENFPGRLFLEMLQSHLKTAATRQTSRKKPKQDRKFVLEPSRKGEFAECYTIMDIDLAALMTIKAARSLFSLAKQPAK
jgi:hypothetical protein